MSDEIAVGPELDRAVGEAMGVEPEGGYQVHSDDGLWVADTLGAARRLADRFMGEITSVHATYSTGDAGPVLEWLARQVDADVHLTYYDGQWECGMYTPGVEPGSLRGWKEPGDTWQEAVCRAALAWKGRG